MKKIIIATIVLLGLIGGAAVDLRHATQTPGSASKGRYVALGDSVAAGLGLGTTAQKEGCGRTPAAYATIVASSRASGATNLACSGATTTDVQRNQLPQLFAGQKPGLITVTIGANDLQWTKLLAQCYRATCGSEADTQAAAATLATLGTHLNDILNTIAQRYTQQTPRVVLTGYYQVLPANKNGCPKIDELTDSEIAWWHQQESALNDTIRTATTTHSFAVFASVDFSGHDICQREGNAWVQGLGSQAPFHPTETGQQIIAGTVLSALQKGN